MAFALNLSAAALGAFLASTSAVLADPINTGVGSGGTLNAPGSVDSNWTGVDLTTGAVTAYDVSGYGNYWVTVPGAEFLSPVVQLNGQADNYGNGLTQLINWSETFTLTSNGAASDILGQFAVDNALLGIIISNSKGVFTVATAAGSFAYLTAFDIAAADLAVGSNTVTFETENFASSSGNPTGLLVEFTQVPEPASMAVFGAGLLALFAGARRRV